ncbi:MAG: aspartate/glutamate racemase family protein [Acidobacteriota bacterium]|jgi:aspartate racemase
MKTIGLLGGMSWESTVSYYQIINRLVARRLGGLHSARLVLVSVDFEPIELLQRAGRWDEAGAVLVDAARALERAGADLLVLCTNTMHIVAPRIEAAAKIPLLHIADATGERIAAAGLATVGLLGTRFTMEEAFYRGRLEEGFGLRVLIPTESERDEVHRVIYEELCRGEIQVASRARYREIVSSLVGRGAEGVILGCTEIGLLLSPPDASVELFDTAAIHAEAAVSRALEGED